MKLLLAAVGHRMPAWVSEGFEDYARRMPREMRLSLAEVKPEPRAATSGPQDRERVVAAEWKRIAARLPAGSCKVVLDERGRQLTSRGLAQSLERWQASGRDVAFVIGGADGTAEGLRREADFLWSLSTLTLPHGLVRVMVAEQLYRASSILKNHPYHRE